MILRRLTGEIHHRNSKISITLNLPTPRSDNYLYCAKEFWRVYLKNEMVGAKLNKYLTEKNEILQQIVRIQVGLISPSGVLRNLHPQYRLQLHSAPPIRPQKAHPTDCHGNRQNLRSRPASAHSFISVLMKIASNSTAQKAPSISTSSSSIMAGIRQNERSYR